MPSRRSSCFNATATARIFNGVPAPAVAAICAFSAATLDFCSPVIIANPPRAPPRTPSFAGSGLHVTTGKSEDLRIFNGVPAPAVAAICAFSAATLDFCSPVIIANPPRAPPRTPSFAGSGLHVTTGKSEDLHPCDRFELALSQPFGLFQNPQHGDPCSVTVSRPRAQSACHAVAFVAGACGVLHKPTGCRSPPGPPRHDDDQDQILITDPEGYTRAEEGTEFSVL